MANWQDQPFTPPDPAELAQAVVNIAGRCQELLLGFLARQRAGEFPHPDPLGLYPAFAALTAKLLERPERLFVAQLDAWNAYLRICHGSARRLLGLHGDAPNEAVEGDRRFRDPQWEDNPFFAYVKQVYLLAAETLQTLVAAAGGLDARTAHKVEFYTRQFTDALAPTNFVQANPEVLRETIRTGGKNLIDGLQNFLADLDPESGRLRTRMVDDRAFKLGENIAVTPGKVVFQNELMQLLQYEPTTATVFKRPLLIIPPWINKYYILDLQPKNSFIHWAVEQGHTVFVISWVNPDEHLAHKDFENYVFEGPLAALDAIEQATGEKSVNVIGYCIGGTLLGATLAYLAATGARRVHCATFFTALLDFADPGDIAVFIDEGQLRSLEEGMEQRGYLDGADMGTAFNMLRANDLIWSFFVNNYLLGRNPLPFDLLYWNSDSTRMPAKMHSTYLRKMYLENAFCKPGGLAVGDVAIDLRKIQVPAYFVSASADHIAPWKATFAGAQLLSGPITFVVGQAGHVAGVVNPPSGKQYGYYAGPEIKGLTPDEWMARATAYETSWWPDWGRWISRLAGKKVAARVPGDRGLAVLEDAPGSYARHRA